MIKRILGYLSNPFTLSWVIFVIGLGIYEYWWWLWRIYEKKREAENARSEFRECVTEILKRWCWLIIGCRDCAVPELSHRTFLVHGRAVHVMTKSTGVRASQTLSMQNSVTLRALSGLRRSCWQRGKYRHEPISP